jgi:hypothetical protein
MDGEEQGKSCLRSEPTTAGIIVPVVVATPWEMSWRRKRRLCE